MKFEVTLLNDLVFDGCLIEDFNQNVFGDIQELKIQYIGKEICLKNFERYLVLKETVPYSKEDVLNKLNVFAMTEERVYKVVFNIIEKSIFYNLIPYDKSFLTWKYGVQGKQARLTYKDI